MLGIEQVSRGCSFLISDRFQRDRAISVAIGQTFVLICGGRLGARLGKTASTAAVLLVLTRARRAAR